MRKKRNKIRPLLVGLLLIVAGCASQPPVESVNAAGLKTINIKADTYTFEPSSIVLKQGEVVDLTIRNISDIDHNFTIKDPEGKILQSVDMRAGKTKHAAITFSEIGTYNYYCNLPMHTELGMKGSIEVKPASK